MKKFNRIGLLSLLVILLCAPLDAARLGQAKASSEASVLDDVLMDRLNFNYRRKAFIVEEARAMNLSTDGTDVKVTMKVKSVDGKTLGSYEANALAPKRNKSYWMRGFLGVNGTELETVLPGAGEYLLEFSAGGEVFDRFPFTITTHAGDNGETWFLVNGLWNDHAVIDKSKDFKFSVWMRDLLEGTGKRNSDYGKYSARIVREKDGKVIGATGSNTQSERIAPLRNWKRYDITFVRGNAEAAVGTYDVTAQDGTYAIEFMHDDKLYGKYPFTVSSGKIQGITQSQGTQLETSGGDVIWMKRAGGK
jgi:hypothetical protein